MAGARQLERGHHFLQPEPSERDGGDRAERVDDSDGVDVDPAHQLWQRPIAIGIPRRDDAAELQINLAVRARVPTISACRHLTTEPLSTLASHYVPAYVGSRVVCGEFEADTSERLMAWGRTHGGTVAVAHQALRCAMRYQIIAEPGFVRANLFNRQTAAETGQFLSAIAAECIRLRCYRVLISVRASRPIFALEKYGFSRFVELAVRYSGKVAVLSDCAETRIAHDYAVMLARLRGVNARTFREEPAAVEWLMSGPSMQ